MEQSNQLLEMINGRSPGSNTWRYVNVPYVCPYFGGIFPEMVGTSNLDNLGP